MKFNLQLFAEAVAGKRIVYLYRVLKTQKDKDASAIAFTTENSRSKSKDADAVITKDGAIRTPSGGEVEITTTAILAKGDTMLTALEDAMDAGDLLELWEVNLEEPVAEASNKFKGMYFQGYLTEFEITSNSEDMVEVSLTFGINGSGKRGEVTVSEQQQAIADYMFKDTKKTGA